MSDLLQDINTRELVIENGDLVLCSGVDRARQFLVQRLSAIRSEWAFDLDNGVPYFENVFIKSPDTTVLNGLFIDTILGTPGIIALDSFDLKLETSTRELFLDLDAKTTEGPIEFNNFPVGGP